VPPQGVREFGQHRRQQQGDGRTPRHHAAGELVRQRSSVDARNGGGDWLGEVSDCLSARRHGGSRRQRYDDGPRAPRHVVGHLRVMLDVRLLAVAGGVGVGGAALIRRDAQARGAADFIIQDAATPTVAGHAGCHRCSILVIGDQ
jgi:hypothetical protein